MLLDVLAEAEARVPLAKLLAEALGQPAEPCTAVGMQDDLRRARLGRRLPWSVVGACGGFGGDADSVDVGGQRCDVRPGRDAQYSGGLRAAGSDEPDSIGTASVEGAEPARRSAVSGRGPRWRVRHVVGVVQHPEGLALADESARLRYFAGDAGATSMSSRAEMGIVLLAICALW